MTLSSMTGFARSSGSLDGWQWNWEIRTVNGRGLDIRCRLPQGFEALEPQVRAAVARALERGNCQLTLQASREAGASELRVNEAALKSVLAALGPLAQELGSPPPVAEAVLALRGVLETADGEEQDPAAVFAAILKDLDGALDALAAMRRSEGGELMTVMTAQLDEIERLTGEARDSAERTPEVIRARIDEQLARLGENPSGWDQQRLHQEAALLASRADIAEEIDRLFAHVAAARELIGEGKPCGRRLDFLTQEFNREANTVCSKASQATLTRIGLELKAVIDRLREQVQNIE